MLPQRGSNKLCRYCPFRLLAMNFTMLNSEQYLVLIDQIKQYEIVSSVSTRYIPIHFRAKPNTPVLGMVGFCGCQKSPKASLNNHKKCLKESRNSIFCMIPTHNVIEYDFVKCYLLCANLRMRQNAPHIVSPLQALRLSFTHHHLGIGSREQS